MMRPFRIALIVAAGLLAGTNVWAARAPKPAPQAQAPAAESSAPAAEPSAPAAQQLDPFVQRMKDELKLNEQQTQEISKIYKETRAKRQAQMKELRETYAKMREQIKANLTPEQAKKYEELRREVPEHPQAQQAP